MHKQKNGWNKDKHLGFQGVILLVVLCTLFTASAQFFMKRGSSTLKLNLLSILTNYNIIIGLLFYSIGAVIMIYAFKNADLSTVYPLLSLSFLWVMLLSITVLKERVLAVEYLGMILIVSGIVFIGKGSETIEIRSAK
jgi:drug/metabolite transporter (DMT)-like permease